jgi:ubiquitin carboxyl-terminal hydrolase 9/13
MCDDENVEPIDEADIFRYFGDYPSGAGYVMFYQAADLDLGALGLKTPAPPPPAPATAPAARPIPVAPISKSEPLVEVDEPRPQRVEPISPRVEPIPAVQRTPDQYSREPARTEPIRTPDNARTVQRTPSQSKEDSKWYQRKKEEDQPRMVSSGSYSGGGGLGRKLSGISGKGLMSRSGSLMKLGLGKKDKHIEE